MKLKIVLHRDITLMEIQHISPAALITVMHPGNFLF